MTDYSVLSDEQIAKKVGDVLKLEWANLDDNYNGLCHWKDGDLFVFNPIKDPSIGYPIIVDNGISLLNHWDDEGENIESTTWSATTNIDMTWFGGKDEGFQHSDKNPLRAAMIVFLIMQENNHD